jgi:FkbM family methyltransferase
VDYQLASNEFGVYCLPSGMDYSSPVKYVLRGDVYERETIALLSDYGAGGGIIHAGAFFGDFLPGISRKAKAVWAFEPHPIYCRCARVTVLLNDLTNVVVHQAALGSVKSTGRFKVCDENDRLLGGACRLVTQKDNFQFEVPVVRLDDLRESFNCPIKVLHLDVEGSEPEVIAGSVGLIREWLPLLVFEIKAETMWFLSSCLFEDSVLALGYKQIGKYRLHPNAVNYVFGV